MAAAGQGRRGRRAALAIGLALALLCAGLAMDAGVVRLRRASIASPDLPQAFDGVKVLFLADFHINWFTSPDRAAALVMDLQPLRPDLLLLGGDYTNADPWADRDDELAARERFFLRIADFQAPLGKFGVAGNHDVKLDQATGADLADAMAMGGVTLLRNDAAIAERGGQSIALMGLDDWTEGLQAPRDVAARADAGDYTIVLSHTPDALPPLINQPAQGGARWIDLMLCGHLHGGQVRLFGWSPMVPSIYGDRFLSGWYDEGGAALLVSDGVGALYLPIRLGAEPQAHLIEIHRAERPREES